MTLGLTELLLVFVVVAIGAAVQGSVGLGFPLIAAPFLILVDPLLVPGPVLINALALVILITIRDRRSLDILGLRWVLAGRIVGTVIAVSVIAVISQEKFAILFAVLVLLAVIISALGFHIRATTPNVLLAGTLSGFMGTTSAMRASPLALVYQDEPGARLRSTLSGVFIVGITISLSALYFIGRLGITELLLSITLVPGVLLGYVISIRTAFIVDRQSVRPLVLLLSGTAAIAVLIRSFIG